MEESIRCGCGAEAVRRTEERQRTEEAPGIGEPQQTGETGQAECSRQEETLRSFAEYAGQALAVPDYDVKAYSPLTLAFMGDAVYELVIRTMVVTRGNTTPNQLNKQSSSLAKAAAQAELMHIILEQLTEEELAVYKRGRNAHSATKAKNATVSDYRIATGFEALMGYLYLQGRLRRIIDLVRAGLDGRTKT